MSPFESREAAHTHALREGWQRDVYGPGQRMVALSPGVVAAVDLDLLDRLYRYECSDEIDPLGKAGRQANSATRLAWSYGYLNPRTMGAGSSASWDDRCH